MDSVAAQLASVARRCVQVSLGGVRDRTSTATDGCNLIGPLKCCRAADSLGVAKLLEAVEASTEVGGRQRRRSEGQVQRTQTVLRVVVAAMPPWVRTSHPPHGNGLWPGEPVGLVTNALPVDPSGCLSAPSRSCAGGSREGLIRLARRSGSSDAMLTAQLPDFHTHLRRCCGSPACSMSRVLV